MLPPPPPLMLLRLVLLLAASSFAAANAKSTPPSATAAAGAGAGSPPPVPTPWPEQFHAVIFTNLTESGGRLQLIDLYYDWPKGRSLDLVHSQLSGDPTYSVEWANGTSYHFDAASCRTFHYSLVGLLPPDWEKALGAAYLGSGRLDGFDCHVWSNILFARYYEDAATGRPVGWIFNGMERHVLSFEAGAVLQDSCKWQAPAYCFNGSNADAPAPSRLLPEISCFAGTPAAAKGVLPE